MMRPNPDLRRLTPDELDALLDEALIDDDASLVWKIVHEYDRQTASHEYHI